MVNEGMAEVDGLGGGLRGDAEEGIHGAKRQEGPAIRRWG